MFTAEIRALSLSSRGRSLRFFRGEQEGRPSVEEVESGREELLRGRDQDLGTVAFPGVGGRGLGRCTANFIREA